MMARLIAMHILTYQAGDVRKFPFQLQVRREYGIECHYKIILAAKQLHHAVHIMRHKETILPGSGLRIGTSHLQRLERCFPVAIHPFGTEKLGSPIKHIHIVLRTCNECLANIFFLHLLRHAGYAPVIVGKFQQARDRFPLDVRGDETVPHIAVRPFFVLLGRGYHRFQRFLGIKPTDAFQISICYDRSGVIAYHRPRLSGRKRPDGKFARSIINIQERVHHVIHQSGIE